MSDLVYVRDGRVVAHIEKLQARIEALEAALQVLVDNVKTGSHESTGQAIELARAVLERK